MTGPIKEGGLKIFVAVMAGTDAWDAQPIFASADPDIVGAVVAHLNDRLGSPGTAGDVSKARQPSTDQGSARTRGPAA